MTYEFALMLANHWSFTGIGWQLGIESCVWSINDSLDLAEIYPNIKVCLNLDARAYVEINKYYPETIIRLKKYLNKGHVEIIGGTYGQPIGSMISGESVIRQLILGKRAIYDVLAYDLVSFLEEEEFSFTQLPQILVKCGFKYASLAQCDTWGKSGNPIMDETVFTWQSPDGSSIPCISRTELYFHPPAVTKEVTELLKPDGIEHLKKGKLSSDIPLVTVWTEFGWEALSGRSFNCFDIENYVKLSTKYCVAYTTMQEYMRNFAYSAVVKKIMYDDFNKLLPWGIGADQLRKYDREIEANLLMAEKIDVMATLLGHPGDVDEFGLAWQNLLISQSHDVSLCEYTRWGGGVIPPENMAIDTYGMQWGALGYYHLDIARKMSLHLLNYAIKRVFSIDKEDIKCDKIILFNTNEWRVKRVIRTGRIYFDKFVEPIQNFTVHDPHGSTVPYQLYDSCNRDDGSLYYVDIGFFSDLPPVGYAIYTLDTNNICNIETSVGKICENDHFIDVENEYLKIRVNKNSGLISSFICKSNGNDYATSEFPVFSGQPSHEYPHWASSAKLPFYSTLNADVSVEVTDNGPISYKVKSTWKLQHMQFEASYTLEAYSRSIKLDCRLKVHLPPQAPSGNENSWQLGTDIPDGYWLHFPIPKERLTCLVDTPFCIEVTEKKCFHARSFLDLRDSKCGMHISHGGNQYYKIEDGVLKNLLMREWESHFTKQYGWPVYSTYSYVITPHSNEYDKAGLKKIAIEKDHQPIMYKTGNNICHLPSTLSFFSFEAESAYISSIRCTISEIELRVAETSGKHARIRFDSEYLRDAFTKKVDLNGNPISSCDKVNDTQIIDDQLIPWEIATYTLYDNNRYEDNRRPNECKRE